MRVTLIMLFLLICSQQSIADQGAGAATKSDSPPASRADGATSTEEREERISIDTIRSNAGVCMSGTYEDSAFGYMKAFSSMLTYARFAREENELALKGKPMQSLVHLDKSNQFFACSMLQIAEYRDSKDKLLSLSADAAIKDLNQLYAVNGLVRAQMKDALNGKSMAQGDMAEVVSQVTTSANDAWKRLLPEGGLVTHALLDPNKQGTLNISKKQKAELIAALEKSVKKGYRKDNRAIEVTVKQLVDFFNQPWKYQ